MNLIRSTNVIPYLLIKTKQNLKPEGVCITKIFFPAKKNEETRAISFVKFDARICRNFVKLSTSNRQLVKTSSTSPGFWFRGCEMRQKITLRGGGGNETDMHEK